MTQALDIALVPNLLTAERLQDSTVIVIDVLRASTTIAHALAHGAASIIPFATVDEARDAADVSPIGSTLLAGERGGEPVDGFDLGN
ncbi:2-phosphosulfolactate phosphatase, partial [bacterium]|nr:2-phosphosulfolactate phosphatase [bacterium]